jgi:hypothetical protein
MTSGGTKNRATRGGRTETIGRRRRDRRRFRVVEFERLERRIQLSLVTWIGEGNATSWSDPKNWSTDALPGTGDDVVIDAAAHGGGVASSGNVAIHSLMSGKPLTINGGSFAVSSVSSVNSNLILSGGTFGGTGIVTVSGPSSMWSDGTLSGTVINAGTLTLTTGTSTKTLTGTLTNTGTIAVTGGSAIFPGSNGVTINNQAGAVFDFQADTGLESRIPDAGAASGLSFNNAGTLKKSAGSGTTSIQFPFNDTGGSVLVATGNLAFSAAATFSGTTTLGGAAALNLTGGGSFAGTATLAGAVSLNAGTYTLADGVSLGGSGALQLNGATVSVGGVVTVASLNMAGGTLGGTGTLGAGSHVTWADGAVSGAFTNAGTLTITAGTSTKTLTGTLTNTGTVAVTGGSAIFPGSNGVTINNQAGAVFDFQANAGLESRIPDGPAASGLSFNNAGTLKKSAGSGITTIRFPLNDTGGSVLVATAALSLSAAATFSGTTTLGGVGALILTGGGSFAGTSTLVGTVYLDSETYTLADGVSFGGSGALQLNGATVSVGGVVTVASLNMAGGTLGGTGTLGAGSQVTWADGAVSGTLTNAGTLTVTTGTSTKTLAGTLTNTGTVAVTGGSAIFPGSNGVTINNQAGAVFDFQANAGLESRIPDGPAASGLSFNNAGTLKKSAGTGTTTIQFPLNDTGGSVLVATAALSLSAAATFSGTTTLGGVGALILTGGGSFAGTSTLAGVVYLDSGTYTLADGVSFGGSGGLQLDGATVSVGGVVTVARLNMAGGTLGGTGTLGAGSQVIWADGAVSGTLTNAGTLTVTTGTSVPLP